MSEGGPGDAPLTDILVYRIPVYGDEADELIRKISDLSSGPEMLAWWNSKIGWEASPESALEQAKIRHIELLKRASEFRRD